MSIAKRILIVDDEADIASILKKGLEKSGSGFEVDAFTDPDQALKKIQSAAQGYDLMLVDFKMPKMDGISFYHKARQLDCNAKVCFITALDSMDEQIQQLAPGLNGSVHYIRKPVSIAELNDKVQSILS